MNRYWLGLCAVVCALGCSSSDDGASGEGDPSLDSGGTEVGGSDSGVDDGDTEGGVTPEGFGKISGVGGRYFAVAGNKAYFQASDSEHGEELWVTDGTTPGTHFVKDTKPGTANGVFALPRGAGLGDKLVFGATGDVSSTALWISDGTEAGTQKIHDVEPVDFIGVAGGHAYFVGKQSATGHELWTTDGTAAGTHIVVDYNPGADSSSLLGPVVFGDKFIFQAFREDKDGTKHGHTYITSGAPSDAVQLTPDSSVSGQPFADAVGVQLGSKVVFLWLEPTHGQEPWITDGTPAGTHLIKDAVTGTTSSYPMAITVLGSKAYFFGYDGSSGSFKSFWETDGTEAGTTVVAKVDTDANVSRLFVKDGKAYYPGRRPATSGATDIGLWVTDGTAAGTRLVSGAVNPSAWSFYPTGPNNSLGKMVAVKDKIVFFGFSKDFGTEPWVTDGTDAGTQRLGDVYPGMYGCINEDSSIFELNGKAYWSAVVGSSSKTQLFESDGTAAGTKAVMPAGMMLDQTTIHGEPIRLPATIVFSGSFGEGDYGIYKL